MPQSLANVLVHLVFSTKNREGLITEIIEPELYRYTSAVLEMADSPMITIGGLPDHVHILFKLSRKKSIAEIVESVKSDTSRWIKTKGREFSKFYWQAGYGAFSVSPTSVVAVKNYIAGQKEHHREKTFQDEFRELMAKAGIEIDERYVWD